MQRLALYFTPLRIRALAAADASAVAELWLARAKERATALRTEDVTCPWEA